MVNVLAPRAGFPGLIASLLQWGVQIIDVVSGAGAINKYTVGPAWTGAEFQTVQAAVDAAEADGVGGSFGGPLFFIYPGFYSESVVIPATVANFQMVGAGSGVGSFISSLTINSPNPGGGSYSLENVGVTTLNLLRAGGGSTINVRLYSCEVYGAFTIDAPDLRAQVDGCDFFGAASARNVTCYRVQFRGCVIGASNTNNAITTTTTEFTRFYNCVVFGRCVFNGLAIVFQLSKLTYAGSPAVTDNVTGSSWFQGNLCEHDAGPAGPVWIKTGPGLFHEGGNTFSEGQEFPWYSVAGTITDPAESDVQLRRVFEVSGSPVLTAAQVGGQRKTTVVKTDNGGVVSLPSIASLGGVREAGTLIIVDGSGAASGGNITVDGSGAETINGAANYVIAVDFEAVEMQVVSATNWAIVGRYP